MSDNGTFELNVDDTSISRVHDNISGLLVVRGSDGTPRRVLGPDNATAAEMVIDIGSAEIGAVVVPGDYSGPDGSIRIAWSVTRS